MLQTTGIAFALYHVTEVVRARKFYEQILGLKVCAEMEFAPGQWWIEYDIAGQALAISNAMPGGPAASLTLEVANVDDALATAKSAGIELAYEIMEFPPCRTFAVKDPDGNQIGLHQLKAK